MSPLHARDFPIFRLKFMRNSGLDSESVCLTFWNSRPTVTLQYLFTQPTFFDTDKNLETYAEMQSFRFVPTFGGQTTITTDILLRVLHINLVQCANTCPTQQTFTSQPSPFVW